MPYALHAANAANVRHGVSSIGDTLYIGTGYVIIPGISGANTDTTSAPPTAVYPPNTVHCNTPTAIVDIASPTTGKTWMDRNLGATQVATSSNDANAYGDLYQWGRFADGHQCRNSATSTTLSSTDLPEHSNFILINSGNFDWRSPQNVNLWQGVSGINNPCPTGYRLPTESEFNNERTSWSSNNGTGAFSSPLKFTMAGDRDRSTGLLRNFGTIGLYWSSTVISSSSRNLFFNSSNAGMNNSRRAFGYSVRCIKEVGITPQPLGSINTLECSTATNNGTLTASVVASGVNSVVPYTGGVAGSHNGQTVTSTGVTGLTATLVAGTFANGAGTLTYTITGTPSASGTASFALNIGGQSCTLNRTVAPLYPVGSVFCASGATAVVEVTNPTTGRVWMDRNLGATQVATSSTDANSYGDLYQWGRRSDGHQCRNSPTTATLSSTDQPAHGSFILINGSPNDWRNPQNNNLWQGVSGINNPCPTGFRLPTETEFNAERLSWSSNNAAGAFASPLKLTAAGGRLRTDGSLFLAGTNGYYLSSTTSSTFVRSLNFDGGSANNNSNDRAFGSAVRCIKDDADGSLGALNCSTATNNGTLTAGVAASGGVTSVVPYTGGAGSHNGQIVTSTGVTGLTATLVAGTFANGAGTLTYTITGTPSASGTASFALNIGGQSCTLSRTVVTPLYPVGSVFCASGATAVVEVTNPTTGRIWMNRNLGGLVPVSSVEVNAFGDLYQWGRRSDGHQCRNSATTTALSSTDQPAHGSFILINGSPNDWRNQQNNNLWQGVDGINNPCPNGFRLPTEAEWNAERVSWSSNNAAGAFASPLKLTAAGGRLRTDGSLFLAGTNGYYLSSTTSSTFVRSLNFDGSSANINSNDRAFGSSVRCIKDVAAGSLGALNCSTATNNGTLTASVVASGVNSVVPYTGGVAGSHNGQIVTSTGVKPV